MPHHVIYSFTEYQEVSDLMLRYSDASWQEIYSLWFAVVLSGVMGMGISYASGWALRITSSTTFSMVGALNKLPLSLFGMLLFEDVTATKLASVAIACAAGITYTFAKNSQSRDSFSLPQHLKERR